MPCLETCLLVTMLEHPNVSGAACACAETIDSARKNLAVNARTRPRPLVAHGTNSKAFISKKVDRRRPSKPIAIRSVIPREARRCNHVRDGHFRRIQPVLAAGRLPLGPKSGPEAVRSRRRVEISQRAVIQTPKLGASNHAL